MATTKLSISVDPSLARFVEHYQKRHDIPTKSEVVERALTALREAELAQQYADAYREWAETEDAELWETTVADGLKTDEAR
jgi:Arc/MetJ-type ribon-helix-helix transcriptional regulator